MKKFKIQRVSGFILSVMLLITLIILGLFFFGGETPMDQRVVADPSLSEPLYTDVLELYFVCVGSYSYCCWCRLSIWLHVRRFS